MYVVLECRDFPELKFVTLVHESQPEALLKINMKTIAFKVLTEAQKHLRHFDVHYVKKSHLASKVWKMIRQTPFSSSLQEDIFGKIK